MTEHANAIFPDPVMSDAAAEPLVGSLLARRQPMTIGTTIHDQDVTVVPGPGAFWSIALDGRRCGEPHLSANLARLEAERLLVPAHRRMFAS